MSTGKLILAAIVTVFVCQLSFAVMAAEVTVVGEVNDTYQLVSDGLIYAVAENEAGEDLVLNYVGEKVKVIGTVMEVDGEKTIKVKSFTPVGD